MTARTIGPMGRSRRELRHDTRLATAWVRSRRSIAPSLGGTWWTRGDAPPRPRAASGGPFLVMLTSESSPALAELVAQAIRGARVYVLASSG